MQENIESKTNIIWERSACACVRTCDSIDCQRTLAWCLCVWRNAVWCSVVLCSMRSIELIMRAGGCMCVCKKECSKRTFLSTVQDKIMFFNFSVLWYWCCANFRSFSFFTRNNEFVFWHKIVHFLLLFYSLSLLWWLLLLLISVL